MLCEASESERPELRRKLDDHFFNEDHPYDRVSDVHLDIYFSCSPTILKCLLQERLGLPGWKSRFHREYFGLETSNEIGNLQNDMVMFFLVYSFIHLSLETWQGDILCCCNLPSLSFSLLPLNLGSEVFRRTLLGVSMLFCGCTIMELVRITYLHILKINLFHGYGFYLSHSTFYGTTCCRYYPFSVAPFVSSLKGLSRFQISFAVDKPLRPFDQLMAVLPSQRHVHHSCC
jgi:hypothetical protein